MPVLQSLVAMSALVAVLGTAGCGSVGTNVPTWAGGLPPEAPAPAATPAAFPQVHDVPPPRAAKLYTESEQAKLEAELAAIRDRMRVQAGTLEKEETHERR